ncbi:MAG: hypothetical protein HRS57_02745 [Mycoplasmataceae bacterium]|nr:hypothetical protein [Mycoplasmataceae bacterium]
MRINKEKNYEIIINNKNSDIYIKKINDFPDKVDKLIKVTEINFRHGFVIQNQTSINTFLLKYNVDIVVTNKRNYVIDTLESFESNKITSNYKDAKNFFIFAENTIRFFNINKSKNITFEKINSKKMKW